MSDEELGVEEVKEAAEVEEPVTAEPVEAPVPEPVPATDVSTPVAAAPVADIAPRSNTGLIIAVGTVALLLIVGLLAWQPILDTVSKLASGNGAVAGTTDAAAKAKISATVAFIEAYFDGDLMGIKPLLTDEAQAAGTDAQWAEMASQDSTGNVIFAAPVWTGDTTAVVTYSAPDILSGTETTGTLTFSFDAAKPLEVAMEADTRGTKVDVLIVVVAAGSEWRIASLTTDAGTETYDAAFIKSIVPTDTPQ